MPRHPSLPAALLFLMLASPSAAQSADPSDWIPLFDGKSLDGWVPKITGYDAGVNFGNTFRVENGVLKVAYDQYDRFANRFGHLFHRTSYSRYVLAIEYRFVGDQAKDGPAWAFRNSGVMIHGQPIETMGKDQDFPILLSGQNVTGGKFDYHDYLLTKRLARSSQTIANHFSCFPKATRPEGCRIIDLSLSRSPARN